ncbi:MAG: ATP synthase subunit I [Microthrixaceae bacterium]|nr:ATP synthase subunit I [Microthrixaceae bacterium]MCO5317615.1 ATP synthase subunit I [Microthrixaceae bacterium]
MSTAADPVAVHAEGPSPAMDVALDMAKRSVWLLPVAILVSAAGWGIDGVASTLYAIAIVVVNFLAAGWLLKVGGRISPAAMGAAAMFGFLARLGLIFLAVLLVKDAGWLELVPFGVTLIVTHLVLLFWELRHISSSLAFPGLKPAAEPNPYLPENQEPA